MGISVMKSPAQNVQPIRFTPRNAIQCADNIEFMRSLKKESINLIVTSPPYNIGKD